MSVPFRFAFGHLTLIRLFIQRFFFSITSTLTNPTAPALSTYLSFLSLVFRPPGASTINPMNLGMSLEELSQSVAESVTSGSWRLKLFIKTQIGREEEEIVKRNFISSILHESSEWAVESSNMADIAGGFNPLKSPSSRLNCLNFKGNDENEFCTNGGGSNLAVKVEIPVCLMISM